MNLKLRKTKAKDMIRFKKIWPIGFFFLISACGSDDNPASEHPIVPPPTETYTAPTYKDDYSSIASWENRSNWNLANVHDPTVAKCGDYYYMYSTDASYGNAHEIGRAHV